MENSKTVIDETLFNELQLDQISKGVEDGLDVSIFAKPEFDKAQMDQIRKGLENNLDVSIYAKPEFGWQQMLQIVDGLAENVDVSIYAKTEFDNYQMSEILNGLIANFDVSIYAKPEVSSDKMREIRFELTSKQNDLFNLITDQGDIPLRDSGPKKPHNVWLQKKTIQCKSNGSRMVHSVQTGSSGEERCHSEYKDCWLVGNKGFVNRNEVVEALFSIPEDCHLEISFSFQYEFMGELIQHFGERKRMNKWASSPTMLEFQTQKEWANIYKKFSS